VSKGAALYAGSLEKPHMDIKKELLSVVLSHNNGILKGRVFSNDLKSSFLGYSIEIGSLRIPLKIDGKFKLKNPPQEYHINIYENDNPLELDAKSPNHVIGEMISVPFLNKQFNINGTSTLKELMKQYSRLLRDIDYLNDYTSIDECEIQKYIETLLEMGQRDKIALNQAEIYISYLKAIVDEAKYDLEYSVLLENVSRKMKIIECSDILDIGEIGKLEEKNLDELKDTYSLLVEKYVSANRDDVIEECFFNLKLDGIYNKNEKLADELIENANAALADNDYEELFDIVNVLYEIDERD
jgi:hypothetical protein